MLTVFARLLSRLRSEAPGVSAEWTAPGPVLPFRAEDAMKITPLDIQQKRFSRAVRGYDREEVEAFLAGGGVAGVIEVHQQQVVFALFEGGEDSLRRGDGVDLEPFGLEQKPERSEYVLLVIGDQKARLVLGGG
jgi:DivIVA domain-containing protein